MTPRKKIRVFGGNFPDPKMADPIRAAKKMTLPGLKKIYPHPSLRITLFGISVQMSNPLLIWKNCA